MCMLTRRLQILLDDERHERLTAESRRSGRSVGALVRDALDRTYPSVTRRKREAARRILAAPRMPIGDPEEIRAELDELRSGGL